MLSPLIVLGCIVLWLALKFIRGRWSALKKVPGPPSPSWLYGNMEDLLLTIPYGVKDDEWQKEYGPVYRISGGLGEDRLVIADAIALKAVVSDIQTWIKPPALQMANRAVVGDHSIISSFGPGHRRLRAILNPLFSARRTRTLVDVLTKVAQEVGDAWSNKSQSVGEVFDVLPEIHMATLRSVGEGLVSFDFSSHQEFAEGYRHLLRNTGVASKWALLRDSLMRYIPEWLLPALFKMTFGPLKMVLRQREIAEEIATQLLNERITAMKDSQLDDERDLIAALLNANRQLPEQSRLTNSEIVGQFGSVNLAGEDTTANSLSWVFYELAKNPKDQERIRQEFNAVDKNKLAEDPSLYDHMTYLNAFLKEVFRFHSTVPQTTRCASRDCVLPLSTPMKLLDGQVVNEIPVPKGTVVVLSISGYNCSTDVWGPDATEFKPSRWLRASSPTTKGTSLGPFGNILTFYGGPRVCLGWRFAVLEEQIMITEALRRFIFELPKPDNVRSSYRLTLVTSNPEGEPELKLSVRPVT